MAAAVTGMNEINPNDYQGQLLVDNAHPMIVVTHTMVQGSRVRGEYNNGGTWERCRVNMPATHEMKVSAGPVNLGHLIRPVSHPATLLLNGRPAVRGTVMLNDSATLRGRTSMDAVFTEAVATVKVPAASPFVQWLDRTLTIAEKFSEPVRLRAQLDRKLLELHGPASWDPNSCRVCCGGDDEYDRPAYCLPCPTMAVIGWQWAGSQCSVDGYREEWKPNA